MAGIDAARIVARMERRLAIRPRSAIHLQRDVACQRVPATSPHTPVTSVIGVIGPRPAIIRTATDKPPVEALKICIRKIHVGSGLVGEAQHTGTLSLTLDLRSTRSTYGIGSTAFAACASVIARLV